MQAFIQDFKGDDKTVLRMIGRVLAKGPTVVLGLSAG